MTIYASIFDKFSYVNLRILNRGTDRLKFIGNFAGKGADQRPNAVRVQRAVRAIGSREQLRRPTGRRHHGQKLGKVFIPSCPPATHFAPTYLAQGAGDAVRAGPEVLRVQERAGWAGVQVPVVEDGRRDGRRAIVAERGEHGEGGFAGQGPGREHDGRRGRHLPRGASPGPWKPAA